jgi:TonB family protein
MIRSMIHDNTSFLIAVALASIGFLAIALIVERFARRASAASRHTIVFAAMLVPAILIAAAAVSPRSKETPVRTSAETVITGVAEVAQQSRPLDVAGVVAAIWLIGALVSLARSGRSALYWRRVARSAEVKEALVVSNQCSEPMVIGIIKPTIVFPAGDYIESLTAAELETVLAHEMAHIARRDNLIALVVQLTCAFFWFDPIHRIARRRLVALRERACDEAVLERGCDADSYLSALARSCEVPFRSSAVACMSRLQLRERMESIMTYKFHRPLPASIVRMSIVAAIAIAAVAFTLLAPSPRITAAEATVAGQEVPDFSVHVMHSRKMLYVLSLKSDVFTGVTELASVPDVRTMTTTVGNRTYKWVFQVNSDGSGTANLEVTEGASVIATSTKPFDAPMAIPPVPPPPPRADARRIDATMTPPKLVSHVDAIYPEAAKKSGIAGMVILELIINEDGSVSDVRVIKPLPLGLDQAAVEAVRQFRFEPATLAGKPIPVIFNITMNFKPEKPAGS